MKPGILKKQKSFPKNYSHRTKRDKSGIYTSGIKSHNDKELVSFESFDEYNEKYHYRVFDNRFICYDLKRVLRNRHSVMKHILKGNISLISSRQNSTPDLYPSNLVRS